MSTPKNYITSFSENLLLRVLRVFGGPRTVDGPFLGMDSLFKGSSRCATQIVSLEGSTRGRFFALVVIGEGGNSRKLILGKSF